MVSYSESQDYGIYKIHSILGIKENDPRLNLKKQVEPETIPKSKFFEDQQDIYLAFREVIDPFKLDIGMVCVLFKLMSIAAVYNNVNLLQQVNDFFETGFELNSNIKRKYTLPLYIGGLCYEVLPRTTTKDARRFFIEVLSSPLFKKHGYKLPKYTSGKNRARKLQNKELKRELSTQYQRIWEVTSNERYTRSTIIDAKLLDERLIDTIAKLLKSMRVVSKSKDIIYDWLVLLAFGGAIYHAESRGYLTIKVEDVLEAWGVLLYMSIGKINYVENNSDATYKILSQLKIRPMTASELVAILKIDKSNLSRCLSPTARSQLSLLKRGLVTTKVKEDERITYLLTTIGKNFLQYKKDKSINVAGSVYKPRYKFRF